MAKSPFFVFLTELSMEVLPTVGAFGLSQEMKILKKESVQEELAALTYVVPLPLPSPTQFLRVILRDRFFHPTNCCCYFLRKTLKNSENFSLKTRSKLKAPHVGVLERKRWNSKVLKVELKGG